jgi:hypothetical protein
VDVTATAANEALAYEKVMSKNQPWRKGGRKLLPVLKSGEKWPAVSVLVPPSMQPLETFEGAAAGERLMGALAERGLLPKGGVGFAAYCSSSNSSSRSSSSNTCWNGTVRVVTPAAAAAAAAAPGVGVAKEAPAGGTTTARSLSVGGSASATTRAEAADPGVAPWLHVLPELQSGARDMKGALVKAKGRPLMIIWHARSSSTDHSNSSNSSSSKDDVVGPYGSSSSISQADVVGLLLPFIASQIQVLSAATAAGGGGGGVAGGAGSTECTALLCCTAANAAASAANKELATALGVSSFPAITFFHGNKAVAKITLSEVTVWELLQLQEHGLLGDPVVTSAMVGPVIAALRKKVEKVLRGVLVTKDLSLKAAPAAAGGASSVSSLAQEKRTVNQMSSSRCALESAGLAAAAAPDARGASSLPLSQEGRKASNKEGMSTASKEPAAALAAAAAAGGEEVGKVTSSSLEAAAAEPDTAGTESLTNAIASGSSSSNSSKWDPPKGKKAGFKKRISLKGPPCVYWPRMPCLECGCPWWLGEDWDAECARCGWDCEEGGYDDDCNPLPEYKARYQEIQAELATGRVPAWELQQG